MAITISSPYPNHYPSFSSSPTINPHFYCSKNASVLVQNLEMAAVGAGGFGRNSASPALQASRTAVADLLPCEIHAAEAETETETGLYCRESENGRAIMSLGVCRDGVRRKRRKKIESLEKKEDKKVHFKVGKSRKYLSPEEVAECSWYLKEEARVEAVRRVIKGSKDSDPTLNQWAKAAGMNTKTLNNILLNAKKSKQDIIRSYKPLVVSVASSYKDRGLRLEDLIQEGNIGLLHGTKKFNPERGVKLSTYVYWWIRQAILKAIANKSRVIRLPGRVSELVPKICNANAELSRKLHRFPTHDEIAEALEMKSSTVRQIMQRTSTSPISIDQVNPAQGYGVLQNVIPGPEELTPDYMVRKQHIKKDVQKIIGMLCDREASILRLYYGLNGNRPHSWEEVGKLFNLSRERVRQINCDAIFKLRNSNVVDDLKGYLN